MGSGRAGGCHDAIAAIYNVCKGPRASRLWALDADLAAAFDRIDQNHLVASLGSFPARDLIRGWPKAGVFEAGKGFAPTEEGTRQGGVISPCLLNVALHGLEEAAGVRYKTSGTRAGDARPGSPVAVRYANDVVVLCHSQQQAEHAKARLAEWLAPRGLAFNEDKTRIVHLSEGFDFLGFNVRRYPNRKLLIKLSQAAIRRVRERLASKLRTLRGGNAMAVIARLNPVIRGWAAYYRGVVSSRLFSSLDHYLWHISYKWATWRHENKPKGFVGRYFGKFNKFRNDHWVFGDRDSGATWSGSPGRPSNGTCRSRARHPPMTPPWPATGPNGGRRPNPHSTGTACACCPGRTGSARSAGTTCSPPISRPSLPSNGNGGGCTSPAKR